MAPMDDIGVVAKMVVCELLQPFQLGVDGGSVGEVGVESSCSAFIVGSVM